jgi:HK97 gp10 family phage protein
MAKATFTMPEDFLLKVSRLGEHTDEIVPKVLEAGGEVLLAQVKSNLHAVLSGNSTGELENSLGLSPAKLNKNGDFDVKVGFKEPRSGGDANAKIASILEHGKHNQPPRPFMKPARNAAKDKIIQTMTEKMDGEIEKL